MRVPHIIDKTKLSLYVIKNVDISKFIHRVYTPRRQLNQFAVESPPLLKILMNLKFSCNNFLHILKIP